MQKNDQEFAVIGAGRFGTFWARHLNSYYPVSVYDTDQKRKKTVEEFASWETLENCLKKKFIFLTIPIRQIVSFLQENRNKFAPGSVVIDCASIKEPVIKWMESELPDNVFYIASHPLFGPDSARGGLKDHIITVIPGRVPYEMYNFLVRFFRDRLQLRVENMAAEEHDRLMAYNLSLIHHLGRTFDGMQIARIPLMMDSLGKLNSIARVVMNDSEELFRDFYTYNRFSEEVRQSFQENFSKILSSLPGKHNK